MLISNLQKLNIALGKEVTLQEIRELYQNVNEIQGKEKYYIAAIAQECISQEKAMIHAEQLNLEL